MPRRERHLPSALIFMLAVLLGAGAHGPAVAQGKSDGKTEKAAKPKPPVQPEVVVPSAESIVILIRSALLCLDQAMATGNYSVLGDLASPAFREANNPERLQQIFGNLSRQVSLGAVAILAPKLPEPPSIDADKRLRIRGFFPGNPVQINFDLHFEAVAARWQLFGIAVNPVKAAAEAKGPAPAPAENKPPTSPAKPRK